LNRFSSPRLFLLLFVLLALPALACNAIGLGPAATETPVPTDTPAPTDTPDATPTPEATATPEATSTPEPTPTAEIDANFTDYESDVAGVSFAYPGDWAILDFFFLAVASDESLLEEPTGSEDGAVVAIFTGDSDETSGPAVDQLDEALAELEFEDATLVDGPTATEIQGQEAILTTLESVDEAGMPITIRLAIIINGPRTAIVAGITPTGVAENYLPTIEAIIKSVEVFEPTEEDPFGDVLGGEDVPAGELILLEPGQFVTGTIPEDSFQDYQFSGSAGTDLIVALQPEAEFDPRLEIFPPGDEAALLADVDSGFPGEKEVLVFTPEADGDYIVRVIGFAGSGGEYLLGLFDLTQGITQEGAVADDESSEFRVCVPAGEPLIAVVFPDEDFDPVFNLSGPAGGQLIDEVDDGASGDAEVIFYTGGMDGEENYPVIISLEGFAGFGGTYILFVGPAGVVQDGC
jgi:hypothetical protein